jgi:serine phosphatase RsbU (regulator of sigma subunit)
MKQLHLKGNAFKAAQRKVHQQLLDTFGPGHRLELLRGDNGEVWRFKSLQKDQYYLWDYCKNNISFFMIASSFPQFIERFAIIKDETNKKTAGAGWPDRKAYSVPEGVSLDQMLSARIKSKISGKNIIKAYNKYWVFIEDESGVFYCKIRPIKFKETDNITYTRAILSFSLFSGIIFLALYILSFANINPGRQVSLLLDEMSIRYRILALFSMASVFPVIFSLLIGMASISERAEIIEKQVKGESIANLYRLERMVSQKLEQSRQMADQIREDLKTTPASEKFFRKYLKKYGLPRAMSRLEVRNGKGKILFSTDDREVHGVTAAMDIFSRIALKRHSPERMGKNANLITPAEIVSESALSTDEIGMATVMRQRGKQWIFRMGTFPTIWYWDVYPELTSGPAFMHFTAQMIAVYKKQIKETLSQQSDSKQSLLLSTEMNYRYSEFKIFPRIEGLDDEKLLQAAIVSLRTGKVLFRQITVNNVPYWVTIKPEKSVGSHVFFNLISKPQKLATLEPFKLRLSIIGALALLVSLTGASFLIKLIIRPIGDIAEGIAAIRNRIQNFRIPVRRNDEFGTLSLAFNSVIADFKELEYGRVVQESLLPDKIDTPKGYDLACFRASATDLAGDYHDVLPLNDGRTAIILGDVTGHGISAALAMAMAKATVNFFDLKGECFPGYLMDRLNSLFNKELKPRHKFMTFVTLVLNPKNSFLEIDNAGQSFPYYYESETDSAREIQIPSMPLGAMKKRRGKPQSLTMKSRDGIILYSDGIIECSNSKGEMFGYDRFRETYMELVRTDMSAQEILTEMMERLDNFRKPGPYPDDVTLVLLKKL